MALVASLRPPGRSTENLIPFKLRWPRLGGLIEAPADFSFMVATVPVTATFGAIERIMTIWAHHTPGAEWYFANMYDDDDQPLNWWNQT